MAVPDSDREPAALDFRFEIENAKHLHAVWRHGVFILNDADVAEALMAKAKEADLLQDINSCCEFLNTRDYIKRNIHGVVGFGMGGSLALRFACQRKRLRAAVSFYGRVGQTREVLKDLFCPVLYHHAGQGTWAGTEEVELLQAAAGSFGKRIEIRSYPDAHHAFMNETQPASFNEAAASSAWDTTVTFLKQCFQGA